MQSCLHHRIPRLSPRVACILSLLILLEGGAAAADGWTSLFDGKTLAGWRPYATNAVPGKGWVIEDGCLKKQAKVPGRDLVSEKLYVDFELEWEWRIPAQANSGLKYFVVDGRKQPLGHEYQMADDAAMPAPKHQTAAFYDVLPRDPDQPGPRIGEWNQSRLLVRGTHVEHWLNGRKVLAYECGSEPVMQRVAASKFKNVPGFGTKVPGRILLQDHVDEVWLRNLRGRELKP